MIASTLQPPRSGVPNRVLLSCLVLAGLVGPAQAQDAASAPVEPVTAAEAPATDPAAAPTTEPGAADAAVPAQATTEPPLETIPVPQAEPAPMGDKPTRPYTFAATRLRHTELDTTAEDAFGIELSYLLLPNIKRT